MEALLNIWLFKFNKYVQFKVDYKTTNYKTYNIIVYVNFIVFVKIKEFEYTSKKDADIKYNEVVESFIKLENLLK